MEHRWGRRAALAVGIRLTSASGETVTARTENISLSGALLQTARPVSAGSQVRVEVLLPGRLGPGGQPVSAHVTRSTEDGVALEWCEFAPFPVRLLLAGLEVTASGPRRSPDRGTPRPPKRPDPTGISLGPRGPRR